MIPLTQQNFHAFDSEGNGITQPRDWKKVLFRFGVPITLEEFKQCGQVMTILNYYLLRLWVFYRIREPLVVQRVTIYYIAQEFLHFYSDLRASRYVTGGCILYGAQEYS